MRQWPDAGERLLLAAALGDGELALAAFAAWRASIDWDGDLDGGSFRMLPLVHANMARLGCDDPLMPRLGGVYRHSWCEAQVHLRAGARALALLRDRSVPVMVSKGLLLATRYYASPALRPMADIDLLVPLDRALAAIAVLDRGGWREEPTAAQQWGRRRRDMLTLTAGLGMIHPRDGEIDLHWRLVRESRGATTEAMFWRDALPVTIAGVEALRPSPAHLLFHVVSHGVRPNILSPLRWVADAAMVLRRDDEVIDWDEVMRCAERLRVGRRVAAGLAYLRDEIGLPVPAGVTAAVPRTSWIERVEDASFRAGVATSRQGRWLEAQAAFGRIAVSDARGALPRLALRWAARRLVPSWPQS